MELVNVLESIKEKTLKCLKMMELLGTREESELFIPRNQLIVCFETNLRKIPFIKEKKGLSEISVIF